MPLGFAAQLNCASPGGDDTTSYGGNAITVDASGNINVAGYATVGSASSGMIAKLNASSGARIMRVRGEYLTWGAQVRYSPELMTLLFAADELLGRRIARAETN
jgi:hypothetical protein